MTYYEKFSAYAPEIKRAIDMSEDHEFIRELQSEEPTGSAFSVCDAFSEFWAAWHGGQGSYLYSIGSRFASEFDYDHRSSDIEENTTTRDFYACLCVVFDFDDPIRWQVFGPHPERQRSWTSDCKRIWHTWLESRIGEKPYELLMSVYPEEIECVLNRAFEHDCMNTGETWAEPAKDYTIDELREDSECIHYGDRYVRLFENLTAAEAAKLSDE